MADTNGPAKGQRGQKAKSGRAADYREFTNAALDAVGLPENPNLQFLKQANSLTPTELALIAANIGTGLDNPDKLAVQALSLWQACAHALVNWPAVKAAQICAALPQPKAFPITLDDFLELMLPCTKPQNRMKIFRRFLADCYHADGENREHLERGWENPISDYGYFTFAMRAFYFTEWHKLYLATQESIQSKLKSVSPADQAEVLAYLEEQAAITLRAGCDEACRRWNDLVDVIVPMRCPDTGRPLINRSAGTPPSASHSPKSSKR